MRIFCEKLIPRAMYRLNLLGIVMELLLTTEQHFDIHLYDLDRLYYDKRTKHIFDLLEARQGERNLAVATSLHNFSESPFSTLDGEILRNIVEQSTQQNLAKMKTGEC